MGVSTKSLLVSLPPQVKPPQKEFMSAVFSANLCALQDRCMLSDEQVQTKNSLSAMHLRLLGCIALFL